jgi:uncharacterized tellurite resistance protein B-like protein
MQNKPQNFILKDLKLSHINPPSLKTRSDDVLICIAILGLVATIADGNADYREIDSFTDEFRKSFALTKRQSLKLISAALKRIRTCKEDNVIDTTCDTLNEYLDSEQKYHLFESLAEVLVSDGRVHDGEEYFLDYIVDKLHLSAYLEQRYAFI